MNMNPTFEIDPERLDDLLLAVAAVHSTGGYDASKPINYYIAFFIIK